MTAPSREVVVKVVGFGKSARAAIATARYVADGSEHVPPGTLLRDSEGRHHTPEAAADRLNLMPDDENLSPAARALPDHLRRGLPEQERLRNRQTGHFVLSFPKDVRVDPLVAELIAQDFIAPWADDSYPAFYVPHLRQGMGKVSGPDHIHIVLAMKSSDPGKGRLQIQTRDILEMRRRFARVAARHGIEMTATRRIDRPELQAEIAAGAEPVRAPNRFEPKRRGRLPKPQLLERQAPVWYARHGPSWEVMRAGDDPTAIAPPAAVSLPAPSKRALQGLDSWAAARFAADSRELAARRFLELAAEAHRTAFWYANNRPEVFGTPIEGATALKLTGGDVPLSKTWRAKAAAVLQSAESPQHRGRRLSRARELKAVGDRTLRARSAAAAKAWIRDRTTTHDKRVPADLALALQKVPAWVERFGLPPTGETPLLPALPALPKTADQRLETWIRATFAKAHRPLARERWLAMYAERPETALDVAAHYPELFGALRPDSKPGLAAQRLEKLDLDDAGRAAIRAAVAESQAQAPLTERRQALQILDDLVRERTVVSDTRLAAELVERSGSRDAALDAMRAILSDPDTVTVAEDPESGERQLSTRAVVQAEARLLETAARMAADRRGAVGRLRAGTALRRYKREFKKRTGADLTDQQTAAALHATTGTRLAVVTGAAGAGKSTAFEAARHIWQRDGRQVLGAAPSGIAAQALAETGIEATTLHRLEQRLTAESAFAELKRTGHLNATTRESLAHGARFAAEKQSEPGKRAEWMARASAIESAEKVRTLDRRTRDWIARQTERRTKDAVSARSVVVIDEAGMVGHEQLDRVMHRLDAVGAKVVLAGDPEQLQPIAAGGALRAVQKQAPPSRLTQVRRQREAWQQEASARLASGSAEAALEAFNAYGSRGFFRTGIEGYDRDAQVKQAEQALGRKLSIHEQTLLRNVLDYASDRQVAGRAFAEGDRERGVEALHQRADAALRIGEDLAAHKPWIDRLGVDGVELARHVVEAREEPRRSVDHAAGKLIQRFELDRQERDVRLRLDPAAGARAQLIEDHKTILADDPDQRLLILAYTNEDVSRLNAGAREAMRELGLLTSADRVICREDGEVRVAPGDRILITSNLYGGEPRRLLAANGAIGTVTAIGPAKSGSPIELRLDNGANVTLGPSFQGWQHGYAATVHKSQGATVDRTFILDHSRFDRHLATVALTRHRDGVHVYAAAAYAATPTGLARRWSEARSKTTVADHAAPAAALGRQIDPDRRAAALDTAQVRDRLFPSSPEPAMDGPAPQAGASADRSPEPGRRDSREVQPPAAPEGHKPADPDTQLSPLAEVARRLQASKASGDQKKMLQESLRQAREALAKAEAALQAARHDERDLQRSLEQVYRDPQEAAARIRKAVEGRGLTTAIRELETRPEEYGRLHGTGVGPLRSQARRSAQQAAGKAAPRLIAATEARRTVDAQAPAHAAHQKTVTDLQARLAGLRSQDRPTQAEIRRAIEATRPTDRRALPGEDRQALADELRRQRAAAQTAAARQDRGRGGRGR